MHRRISVDIDRSKRTALAVGMSLALGLGACSSDSTSTLGNTETGPDSNADGDVTIDATGENAPDGNQQGATDGNDPTTGGADPDGDDGAEAGQAGTNPDGNGSSPGTGNNSGATSGQADDGEPQIQQASFDPVEIGVPTVPSLAVAPLLALNTTGTKVATSLAPLFTSGIEVTGASCHAGSISYTMPDLRDELEASGEEYLTRSLSDGSQIRIASASDGSTSLLRTTSGGETTAASLNADGSGTYQRSGATAEGLTDLMVAADGSGRLHRSVGGNAVDVELRPDGSGSRRTVNKTGVTTDLQVRADGSGSYSEASPDGAIVEIAKEADGSINYTNTDHPEHGLITLAVEPDKSGTLAYGPTTILVHPDGTGLYVDSSGQSIFKADGILDPAAVVIGELPSFTLPDRLPSIADMAPTAVPCATIVRAPTGILLSDGTTKLTPAANQTLRSIATALNSAGGAIEVRVHAAPGDGNAASQTDEQAKAIAKALTSAGATGSVTASGYGDRAPLASGSAAAGLNRRVEFIVQN